MRLCALSPGALGFPAASLAPLRALDSGRVEGSKKLNCGSWRAEATQWGTLTCSKLSYKQCHFGLFWTGLGETIVFVQPSTRKNTCELSCSTLLLASFSTQTSCTWESLKNHALAILFTIFGLNGPFGELVWEKLHVYRNVQNLVSAKGNFNSISNYNTLYKKNICCRQN